MIQRFNWEIFNVIVGLRLRKWDEQVSWILHRLAFSTHFSDFFTYNLQYNKFELFSLRKVHVGRTIDYCRFFNTFVTFYHYKFLDFNSLKLDLQYKYLVTSYMNEWCRGKTSAWLSEDQWIESGWRQFFLLGNAQTYKIFQAGKGNNSRKFRSGNKNSKSFSNIPEYSGSG